MEEPDKLTFLEEWGQERFLDWLWKFAGPNEIAFLIGERQKIYDQTGSPLAAIEAFLLAMDAKHPPPNWALTMLHEALGRWHTDHGNASLDTCFRLTPGQGQTPIFKQELRRNRNGALCFEIFILQSVLPALSVEEAAGIVADTYRVDEPGVPMLSASTLKSQYDHTWRKRFEADGFMQECRAGYAQWTDEQRRGHCARYYSNAVIKKYFPEKTTRTCLTCDKSFSSVGTYRVCPPCRTRNASSDE
jgi:hypothetical protein